MKTVKIILTAAILFILIFFRSDIVNGYESLKHELTRKPCSAPITYRIGQIDDGFGLEETEFLEFIFEAEKIWETGSGRNLFLHDANGGEMTVNLKYDYRQNATVLLEDYGSDLKRDDDLYKSMKKEYDRQMDDYKKRSEVLNTLTVEYNRRAEAYEAEVEKYNNRGGASRKKYEEIMAEKAELEKMLAQLKDVFADVEDLIGRINNLVGPLNETAAKLNIDIERYNKIGETLEAEFEQGNYRSAPGVREINIFQFENREKLVRVIAHEMGHSIGLGHIDDPESIMHEINIGRNDATTDHDINALVSVCSRNPEFRERMENIYYLIKNYTNAFIDEKLRN